MLRVTQSRHCVMVGCCLFFGVSQAAVAQVRRDAAQAWLYRGSQDRFEARLKARCESQVRRAAKVLRLTESQREKLELAATGDFARYLRRIATVQQEIEEMDWNDRATNREAYEKVRPLKEQADRGLLEEGSLFRSVLESILTKEQSEAYHRAREAQRLRQFRASTHEALAMLEEAIPLQARQRKWILKRLNVMKPPKLISSSTQNLLGALALAHLKDDELAVILDDEQLAAFRIFQGKYRRFAGLVEW